MTNELSLKQNRHSSNGLQSQHQKASLEPVIQSHRPKSILKNAYPQRQSTPEAPEQLYMATRVSQASLSDPPNPREYRLYGSLNAHRYVDNRSENGGSERSFRNVSARVREGSSKQLISTLNDPICSQDSRRHGRQSSFSNALQSEQAPRRRASAQHLDRTKNTHRSSALDLSLSSNCSSATSSALQFNACVQNTARNALSPSASNGQNSAAPVAPRRYDRQSGNWRHNILLSFYFMWHGLCDAFQWPSALLVCLSSQQIRKRTIGCALLNGCIFLGSIFLYEYGILGLLHWLQNVAALKMGVPLEAHMAGTAELFCFILYHCFWIYPVYAFSFILNGQWYQEIALRAYQMQVGKPCESKVSYFNTVKVVADEIYRALLLGFALFLGVSVSFVPYIGPFLSFLQVSWLSSFYCFEYKWMNRGWNLETRVEYFENHWAYFAGFGLPVTFMTFFVNQFKGYGIFALVFPLYIIMANDAKPLPRFSAIDMEDPIMWNRLPIFKMAIKMTKFCVSFCKK